MYDEHGFRKQNTPPGPNQANCLQNNANAYKIQLSILFLAEKSLLSQGYC